MTYSTLQKNIDAIVGSLGAVKSDALFKRIANNLHLTKYSSPKRTELMITFIIAECNEVYGVSNLDIIHKKPNYVQARAISYHLLRKYTPLSYSDIGKRCGQSKRAVIYHHHKCTNRLDIPKLYPIFSNKYNFIEDRVLDYLTQMK